MASSSPFTRRPRTATVFDTQILEQRPGFLSFRVEGPRARIFLHEGGGHRWQRVPPTEKRGRVQTSTVTVAVLPDVPEAEVRINPADLDWKFTLCRGAGGQSVQKNLTGVQLTHRPSGLRVRCENERSQAQNKAWALEILRSKLAGAEAEKRQGRENASRKRQVGSGQRGDKIRTIRTQDNTVRDERTGHVKPFTLYAQGDIEF